MSVALVSGASGQDGSFLTELLVAKGYTVYGLLRGQDNAHRQDVEARGVRVIEGDLTDSHSLTSAIEESDPDEVYNLGAVSHVGYSFRHPSQTANVTALGPLRFLEALRQTKPTARFYQASSSEMFGSAPAPQSEQTPFHPRSPYGCAKVFAHHATVNYREAYGMYAVSGILFNHESERRGAEFVTRKITLAAARISEGRQHHLLLGNIDAKRDWGFAGDYVEAMWRMLQKPDPDDYVIATGKTHSVKDVLEIAFQTAGLGDWRPHVRLTSDQLRPSDVSLLQGDASKASERLGWTPSMDFSELVQRMTRYDLLEARLRPLGPTQEPAGVSRA